jgi:hypothetical protein
VAANGRRPPQGGRSDDLRPVDGTPRNRPTCALLESVRKLPADGRVELGDHPPGRLHGPRASAAPTSAGTTGGGVRDRRSSLSGPRNPSAADLFRREGYGRELADAQCGAAERKGRNDRVHRAPAESRASINRVSRRPSGVPPFARPVISAETKPRDARNAVCEGSRRHSSRVPSLWRGQRGPPLDPRVRFACGDLLGVPTRGSVSPKALDAWTGHLVR